MRLFLKITILFVFITKAGFSQSYKQRLQTLDIKHYNLAIEVNDTTNKIDASMDISIKFKKSLSSFDLDLVAQDSTGLGMKVDSIYQNNVAVNFTQEKNKLTIQPKHIFPNLVYTYKIKYSGIPKDGLIISENLYGNRTFFGDNWPNRAHHWFPCVDHPSDKATIEYTITTPNHYQVIANGTKIDEVTIDEHLKSYHYKTAAPLPTKVMVIGIAEFAIQNTGETYNIPVSTWVYPQTKEKGFSDFFIAKDILTFFIEIIDEYPFEKLANVQSKTRYGGMENAGNIFYYEKSVTGQQKNDELIAHEIAHQWFGNSATEIDWAHVWLSEGFATYFTNLYILKTKGKNAFEEKLKKQRFNIFAYNKKNPSPVINTNTTNYMSLLNINSYQKGAWVLHMLKKEVGEENFWKGIKTYYDFYKYRNATTNDFRDVMKHISGKNLEVFFAQWLEKTGHPILTTNWIHSKNKLRIIIEQQQETPFEFPLDLELIYSDGTSEVKTIQVTNKIEPFIVKTKPTELKEIKLDPNTNLLFELGIQ
ncbi:M1 family metallopeptidase [uncultured Lutibacter sp.]|uniref:M1 family metallopeptidase n=1 Tax=Lutibacter sp. TaxID=1925666 RepID=UPI002617A715|nr:M1 family metallopeptidase [uncultured Lutibacter sp.]